MRAGVLLVSLTVALCSLDAARRVASGASPSRSGKDSGDDGTGRRILAVLIDARNEREAGFLEHIACGLTERMEGDSAIDLEDSAVDVEQHSQASVVDVFDLGAINDELFCSVVDQTHEIFFQRGSVGVVETSLKVEKHHVGAFPVSRYTHGHLQRFEWFKPDSKHSGIKTQARRPEGSESGW